MPGNNDGKAHAAASPATSKVHKKKKKKKKKPAVDTKHDPESSDDHTLPGNNAATTHGSNSAAAIRQVVVKQYSSNGLQAKSAATGTSAASQSPHPAKVSPSNDAQANESPPSELPVAQTEGFSTGLYRVLLETKRAELLCESILLTYRNVARLKKIFDQEDNFRSGEITQDEFFMLINEEKRKLTSGIFEYVGLPQNPKRLKFDDFVVCAVTFAALSRRELLHYAFTLFDHDASGAMDEHELREFCGDLKNKGFFFEKNVQIAQKKMVDGDVKKHGTRAIGDGLVDYEDIANGTTQFPAAFYPILQFQRNIRAATLGEPFWIRVEERQQYIEVLVHYMRLHEGHLPPLSIQEHIKALFQREVYALRKRAVVKYTQEKRQWEMEREAKRACESLLKLEGEH
uniref:EF-hand domain-containing protein n=1 Tax=Globisporangium ultimum (strain ATCC 200006 / CBS 805.95 / DAOM BR144) TaxID=431595 RepID=K3WIE0_GLOUD